MVSPTFVHLFLSFNFLSAPQSDKKLRDKKENGPTLLPRRLQYEITLYINYLDVAISGRCSRG